MSIDKIRETIANLFAVVENEASTEGEKKNAAAMAARLMRRHNLEREDIKAKDDGTFDIDRLKMYKQYVAFVGLKRTAWELDLARFVCSFVGTVKYYTSRGTRLEPSGKEVEGRVYGAVMCFYGPDEDVVLACNLFRDLGLKIAHNGRVKFGGYAKSNGALYCQGFVAGMAETNRRVERDNLEMTGGERGLILANKQLNRQIIGKAMNWLAHDQGIKLRTGSGLGGGSGDGAAYGLGVKHGKQQSVSRNRPARLS